MELREFEKIFKEYHAQCLAFATHYTGDPLDGEEVVQLVFAQLWEKRAAIAITGSVKSYLFTAIRNTAISQWRKQQVRSDREMGFGKLQADVVESNLQARELEKLLHQAMGKLPERCREVFVLSRQQHLKYAEIAVVMDISVKTVENQMGKALKILHGELKEYLPLVLALLAIMKKN